MTLVDAANVHCTRTAHSRADEESSEIPTLVLPRRGLFRYHTGARHVLADANTVLLFHPDQPYRISHPNDDGDDCTALRFTRDVVADALGFASEQSRAWTLGVRTHRALHRSARAALAAQDPLSRDEHALEVLAIVARADPIANTARDAAAIEAVRERLAADLGRVATLAEIARGVHLSPYHLARRFRATTGTSMHQYRLALRLNIALTRLRQGENNLTALALDLGFASHAHFSAAFHDAYDCSPSAARAGNAGRAARL
ncbi:MAG TPA: helix-turn-helix transcriptional regulator [Candidatus Elarobacter sp.]|nr:helix-turn-helix transcriptional regulator [Candidatus Elarobacter sp.]